MQEDVSVLKTFEVGEAKIFLRLSRIKRICDFRYFRITMVLSERSPIVNRGASEL